MLNRIRLYLMEQGLLNLLFGLRWAIVILVVLRYNILGDPERKISEIIPLCYVLYLAAIGFVRSISRLAFDSFISKLFQVAADIIFATAVYTVRNFIDSDSYYLYVIPLLLAVRYFPMLLNFGLVLLVITITLVLGENIQRTSAITPSDMVLQTQWSIPIRCAIILCFFTLSSIFSDYLRLIDGLKSLSESKRVKWGATLPIHPLLENYQNLIQPERARELIEEINWRLRNARSFEALLTEAVKIAYDKLQVESAAVFLVEEKRAVRKQAFGINEIAMPDEIYNPGEGLTGQVLEWSGQTQTLSGKTILSNQVDKEWATNRCNLARYRISLPSHQVRHLLAVPINTSHSTIGILRVINKKAGRENAKLDEIGFTQNDISLLWIIVSQIATALEQEANLRRLEQLSTISIRLVSLFEESEIYRYIMEQAVELLQVEECSIFGIDEDTGYLELKASNLLTLSSPYARSTRPVSDKPRTGLLDYVAFTRKPLVFRGESYKEHPAYQGPLYGGYDHEFLPSKTCTSVMFIPMLDYEEKSIGVLRLCNRRGPEGRSTFTQEDIKVVQLLASQLANAVRREFLFKVKEQQKEQQVLIETSLRKLAQDLVPQIQNPLISLQKIADTSASLFKADLVGILPYYQGTYRFRSNWLTFSEGRISESAIDHPRPGGITERINASPDGYCIVDLSKESEITEFLRRERISCLLGIRLEAEGQTLGLLSIYYRQPHLFKEEQINLTRVIANLTAFTLLNVEYEVVKSFKIDILAQMQEIRRLAKKEQSLSSIFNKVLETIQNIYNFDFVAIQQLSGNHKQATRISISKPGHNTKKPGNLERQKIIPVYSSKQVSWSDDQSEDFFNSNKNEIVQFEIPLMGLDGQVLGYIEAGYHLNSSAAASNEASEQIRSGLQILAKHVGLLLEEFKVIQSVEEQTDYLNHFSHALRSPVLRAMENLDNLINRRLVKPEEQLNRMQLARDNLHHQLEIIQRMLRMRQQEVIGPQYQLVDLVALLDDLLAEHYYWATTMG